MSMYSGEQVVSLLGQQRTELTDALAGAQSAEKNHTRIRRELQTEYQQAASDLGIALLPTLDAPSLARAIQLTGYSPFQHQDPIVERESERKIIQGELAKIESDPGFANGELLRHPRTGTLIVRKSEITEHRRPWAEVLEASQHERLERLLESGYGTDAYNVPFWRLSYYSDWEAADLIAEKFPNKPSFAEIRAEILQARETVATFDGELRDLERELVAGSNLEIRHEQLRTRLASLDNDHLGRARVRLVEHTAGIEPKWINPRLASAPDVQLLYLRTSGLMAKARYLDAMVEEHAGKLKEQLQPALVKIERDIAKFRRPKNYHAWWPRDVIDNRVKSRRERFVKQQQKFESHYTTVYVYDDWNRGRGYDDFVWWYLMTDNRFHGGYIPEVASFEQSHPNYVHEQQREYDDSSAAAVIAEESSDQPSFGVDAS